MAISKNLGIWMDHSTANLMEFTYGPIETKMMDLDFTHLAKEHNFKKSEKMMHSKEQHKQSAYYNRLGDAISHYDEVILFGPTDAKTELVNILKDDLRFSKIKIEIEQTDKMTENQQHAFVKKHFSGR